jgi:hypothetical protein
MGKGKRLRENRVVIIDDPPKTVTVKPLAAATVMARRYRQGPFAPAVFSIAPSRWARLKAWLLN